MDNELVSIIIPTHSGYDGIYESVKSALSQSYKNIEVIVIDDNGRGSEAQKKTESVLRPLMKDVRLTYIAHETNRNGSVARNTGIKHSKGKYIAFLDDDDSYKNNCIEKEVNTFGMLPEDYGIVFCSFDQFFNGKLDKEVICDFDGDILTRFLKGEIESPSSIIMIKREVVDNIGFWDESFTRHQDWEYITRILCKYKAYGIKEVLVSRPVSARHVAKDPERYEKNRMHYINKMKPIIETQSKADRNQIYDHHYMDIAKNYLKNKQIFKCISWVNKTSNPIKYHMYIARDAMNYVMRKGKYDF